MLLSNLLSVFFVLRKVQCTTGKYSITQTQLTPGNLDNAQVNGSGSSYAVCPGYILSTLKERQNGLIAQLVLGGPPCNLFGKDVVNLSIEVSYETKSRLHVKIQDVEDQQYTIPESVFERPIPDKNHKEGNSDLVFQYSNKPFAFWITRRSKPNEMPLFDTRLTSLPLTPTSVVGSKNETLPLNDFNLKFEDQYLEITSALPLDTNIYGLGEVVANSGFRRAIGSEGGTIQTMWARDAADPVDENIYGSHPMYMEHRFDPETKKSSSHGVFLLSAAGSDILLVTPRGAQQSLVQFRMIGGILDFYFLSGPTPQNVIEQYGEVVGLPAWQPRWGFGFHLCRWGYQNLNETREQVTKMKESNIPLEVMWNDIDLYHAVRDFTTDPVSYPAEDVRKFIRELASNNQRYIPIVDAAIPKQVNESDLYVPYIDGASKNVFIRNRDGSEYIGQVWPGYTVFPDWFHEEVQEWWTAAFRNWARDGVEFSGIWLDMNEASSFCDGSCGTDADLSNTSPPFTLPGDPGNPILDYPECYNASIFGPSGNITVNGRLTCQTTATAHASYLIQRRGLGAGNQTGVELNTPPYAIHNANGRLSLHALATNATHSDGQVELDVHNLWGLMEEKATYTALREIQPTKRPFLISRSTFPSSGRWTGHWLGDNFSLWSYLRFSIAGVLQFQLFQIPFVGADTCGFNGNTDEELCNRWMQLSAFTPFYRNHNIRGAIPQEPYRWDSVANSSRTVLTIRYSLLPYWYTLFANSSSFGTPPVRALFFEFPDEPELFAVDAQFLIGRNILVTPVLLPNTSTVEGIFPGRGSIIWRDWYTHAVVNTTAGEPTILSAPLNHINVHIRDGSIFLLHSKPSYTITETSQGPYSLLISLSPTLHAFGTAYIDDGESYPPGSHKTLTFTSTGGELRVSTKGSFHIDQKLELVTILGVPTRPRSVKVLVLGQEVRLSGWQYVSNLQKLVIEVDIDFNEPFLIKWN